MTSENSSSAHEILPFVRSDASRTAVRGVLIERLGGFLAMLNLLSKSQVLYHFIGTNDSYRCWEPEGARELELFGPTNFSDRLFFDDSSSTAIFEAKLPRVWHIEGEAHELREWLCLPSGPRTSISGFTSYISGVAVTDAAAEALPNPDTEIDPDAQRRLKGYERVVRVVTRIAADLLVRRKLELIKIRVRPAWSHEYEETTGIVIQIEFRGSSEDRFSYWEALGREVDALAKTLPANESAFLDGDVSVIVSRI